MNQTWLPIKDFETLYEVSDAGNVRHITATKNHGPNYILQPCPIGNGYTRVTLCNGMAIRINRSIHRLVAEAFLGPCPKGMEVNHKNGNRAENRAHNLEWVTPSQNALHATRVLKTRILRGEEHGMAKLTTEQVIEMRRLRSNGHKVKDIAAQFGIHQSACSRITRGKRWAHI